LVIQSAEKYVRPRPVHQSHHLFEQADDPAVRFPARVVNVGHVQEVPKHSGTTRQAPGKALAGSLELKRRQQSPFPTTRGGCFISSGREMLGETLLFEAINLQFALHQSTRSCSAMIG
jgi:hypothetical protein